MRKRLFAFVMFALLWIMPMHVGAWGWWGGTFEYNSDGEVINIGTGMMPTEGDVDILVFLVDFPDIAHNEMHTKEYAEDIFFGAKNEFLDPETLSNFYETASYGKLQISGQVYGWYTAEHERAYYARNDLEYPDVTNLFWEVIEAYDDTVDFSKYDSDNDGYVDGVYIVYTGEYTSNGPFRTYVTFPIPQEEKDGKKFEHFAFINGERDFNGLSLSHETGHMLGLMDYYDTILGSCDTSFGGYYSLMSDSRGNLDAWSKILLGWVKPIEIENNDTILLRPNHIYPDVAVVRPKEDKNCIFVIECTNLDGYPNSERVRIYRVNYTPSEYGGFKYGVFEHTDLKTIELIYDSMEDDSSKGIKPYTNPASCIVVENEDETYTKEFTGITISHGDITSEGTSCTITYEELDKNRKPQYTVTPLLKNNKLFLELAFDSEVLLKEDACAIVRGADGSEFTMDFGGDIVSGIEFSLYSDEEYISPNTNYSIIIPEGSFSSSYGATNDEIICSLTTDESPTVSAYVRAGECKLEKQSDLLQLDKNRAGYFGVDNGKLCLYEYGAAGLLGITELASVPNDSYTSVEACKLDNDEIVIVVFSGDTYESTTSDFYRLYPNGKCELVKEDVATGKINGYMYSIGRNVLFCLDTDAWLFKYDNTLVNKGFLGNINNLCEYGENVYILCDDINADLRFVNEELNIIRELDYEPITLELAELELAMDYNGYFVGIDPQVLNGDVQQIGITYFDSDYQYVGTEYVEGDSARVFPVENGFIGIKYVPVSFYNTKGDRPFLGWVFSDIACVTIYNENFEKISSYSMDYLGVECGEVVESVVQLDNKDIVIATSWCVYVIPNCILEEVEITHPGDELKNKLEPTPKPNGWVKEEGKNEVFWYEDGVKQGLEGRGKEIYDEASNAWYWLDSALGGAVAKNKDVYQESLAGVWGDKVGEDGQNYGKWVRYDENGHMVKGWQTTENGKYYFDLIFGTMAKGYATIDGIEYYFDEGTGLLQYEIGEVPENGWKTIDGMDYWYENYIRQGFKVDDSYRGKEIYDRASDAWYWLDNIQGGAKAVSKDVYQESQADDAGNVGKWVRYDAEGHMIKGWQKTDAGTYYFDMTYGTMLKGEQQIDGATYYFDEVTGVLK